MRKLLLIALMMAGISASAQDNKGQYEVISKVYAGKAVTAWIYVTAPGPQDSYVMTFAGGLQIGDATFKQGDMVRAQWIDGELQYAVKVNGAMSGNKLLDARWDRQMQKAIKKLERETM